MRTRLRAVLEAKADGTGKITKVPRVMVTMITKVPRVMVTMITKVPGVMVAMVIEVVGVMMLYPMNLQPCYLSPMRPGSAIAHVSHLWACMGLGIRRLTLASVSGGLY